MERSLTQITLAGPARVVTTFLYGELARETAPLLSDICVIEECTHSEPPAVPDEVTDEIIANLMWAQTVEQQILAGMHEPSLMLEAAVSPSIEGPASTASLDGSIFAEVSMHRPTEFGDKICLVKVTRSGGSLENALHNGHDLEEVRAVASDRQQSCKLPSGASIFVYPNQYHAILAAIDHLSLRPHHVVIADAFVPSLLNAIATIPCRNKVKVSKLEPVAWIDDHGLEIAVVERTFLNVKSTCLEKCEAVTQSTSQARNVPNHRRFAFT